MMNVKKATRATFWLVFLFTGIILLIPVIKQVLPYEILFSLDIRFRPENDIKSFFPFIVNLAVWIMIAAGTLDVILNNKAHFQLLGSFSVIIVLGIPIIVIASIPSVTLYIFWGAYQLIAILGTYWTFRKIIKNNKLSGQKLISFIKEIKTGGGIPMGHVSDHYIVFGMALILIILQAVLIVSMLIYMIA